MSEQSFGLEEVEVTIGKDGQVQIQVRGVQGLKCLEITKPLEEALGGQIVARIMNPEAIEGEQPDVDQDEHLTARG